MDKKRAKATGKAALLLLMVLVLAAASTWGALLGDKSAKPAPEDADYFRNHGLPPEAELDAVPNSYQSDRVIFDDRVLVTLRLKEKLFNKTQDSFRQFFSALEQWNPELKTYFLLVPSRIAMEMPFSSDVGYLNRVTAENVYFRKLEQDYHRELSEVTTVVPVFDALERHQEEYIFYRTDTAWTARGAYYGSQCFMEASGGGTFPIESFQSTAKSKTKGNLGPYADMPSDRQFVYLYQNYNPPVFKKPAGTTAPMVSVTRAGTGCFFGYQDQIYEMDGLAENGKVLLLMGRGNARLLAPWMVTAYERIILVDMNQCFDGNLDFWPLMEENQVTDLLVVADMDGLPSVEQYRVFREIAQQVLPPDEKED